MAFQLQLFSYNFWPGSCKVNPLLTNLGYNNNATQNQNELQPIARNLLGINYFCKY